MKTKLSLNSLPSRRAFLRRAAALSSLGLASRFDVISAIGAANAQAADDYKALVCVFMFGGNDGNNTIIPLDSNGYGQYATARPASSGIQLAQGRGVGHAQAVVLFA